MPLSQQYRKITALKWTCSFVWIALASTLMTDDLLGQKWGSLSQWLNSLGYFNPVGYLLVILWTASAIVLWKSSKFRSTILLLGTAFALVQGLVVSGSGAKALAAVFFFGFALLVTLQVNIRRLELRAKREASEALLDVSAPPQSPFPLGLRNKLHDFSKTASK